MHYYHLYNNLKLLFTLFKSFYIVNIDIIIDLLLDTRFLEGYKYNIIILVTYYFNK